MRVDPESKASPRLAEVPHPMELQGMVVSASGCSIGGNVSRRWRVVSGITVWGISRVGMTW